MNRGPLAGATAVTLSLALLGCGPGAVAPRPLDPSACDPDRLDDCERALGEGDARARALAYMEARRAKDANDAWALLWTAMSKRPAEARAVFVGRGASSSSAMPASIHVVETGDLPAPAALSEDEVLSALAGAAGYEVVLRARGDAVVESFPGDALAPFLPALPPIVRASSKEPAALGSDVEIARAIKAALGAASALHYVEAAREAEHLAALTAGEPSFSEPVLRARWALSALGAAGLVLEPAGDEASPSAPGVAPAPAAADTAYGDYLRVALARDPKLEWARRGERITAALPAARREDVAASFAPAADCGKPPRPPRIESARDLVLVPRLTASLARDPGASPRAFELGLSEWLPRYEAAVAEVEKTGSGWHYAASLLGQRGEGSGLDPQGSPAYKRVTAMGAAHLAALAELERSAPARFRGSALLALGTPGVLADPVLRDALVRLEEASVKDRLAAAPDAGSILGGLMTGLFAGLSYPPALRETHQAALQSAFAGRLQGDLRQRAGWGTAGLYALDAVYRLFAGQAPNLRASSAEVNRALSDPSVPHRALGALASAAGRYAALGAEHKLDPATTHVEKMPPERLEAKRDLRAALSELGAPGEAPANVLGDVTDLADGLIAVMASALEGPPEGASGKAAPKEPVSRGRRKGNAPKASKEACAEPPALLSPNARRAWERLGDVRQRILSHPRFKQGDGAWVRRTRLLVTVLSDAMDLVRSRDLHKPVAFTVKAEDARRAFDEGLRDLDATGARDVVAGGYGLARELAEGGDAARFSKRAGPSARQLLGGLGALLRDDGKGGAGVGLSLLAAAGPGLDLGKGDDLTTPVLAAAAGFYALGRRDQADLCLLGTLALSALTHRPPSYEAAALADKNGSRVAWALHFAAEVGREDGAPPDPSAYASGMRGATDDACQVADGEATLAVMQAIRDYSAGKRKEARAALDRTLARAEAEGLTVPRMTYRYEERTKSRSFSLGIGLSFGSGLLAGGTDFSLGVGLRTGGEAEGGLSASLAAADPAHSGEEAGRYYAHVAALAAVYHFLDGDLDQAAAAGGRAVAMLTSGLTLGPRLRAGTRPQNLGAGARAALAVAAEQAGEAGMPMLAGDLWSLVRESLAAPPGDPASAPAAPLDERSITAVLSPLPVGLTRLPALEPVVERAKKRLAVLSAKLSCGGPKVELGAYEEVACDAYANAVGLRAADALPRLPRLKRAQTSESPSARCVAFKKLDGFLASQGRGAYDPDAFTRAVEALRSSGPAYDAAALLARQRRPTHCSAGLVAASRALARAPGVPPSLASDLLSGAINCTAQTGGAEVEGDVALLDETTQRLADPGRNLTVMLSLADLAVRTDHWSLVQKLVTRPAFVDRWIGVHPTAAAGALVLDRAAAVMAGRAPDLAATRRAEALVCESFPAPERAELCAAAKDLAAKGDASQAEAKKERARSAVRTLVATSAGPRPRP